MYKETSTWVDMQIEYKNSLQSIRKVKKHRKNTGNFIDVVDCELAATMENDLATSVKEMKQRALQEYKAVSAEDIINPAYGLTKRQKEITLLRIEFSCKEIAEWLKIDISTVYRIHETSINKIMKVKQQEKKNENAFVGLSKSQQEIYKHYIDGLKQKEIAERLDVSVNTIKTQLKRIKQKIQNVGGDKTIQIS